MVEVKFHLPEDLEEAKMQVRQHHKTMKDGAKTLPWLDYKKTPEERRPSRVLKCAFDLLQNNLHGENFMKDDITMQVQFRCISVKSIRVMHLSRVAEPVWTAAGMRMLTQESRDLVESVAVGVH